MKRLPPPGPSRQSVRRTPGPTPRGYARTAVGGESIAPPLAAADVLAPRRLTRLSSPFLALALYWILGLRLHEAIPKVRSLRLALLALVGGTLLLALRTSPSAWAYLLRREQVRLLLVYTALAVISVPFGDWPANSATMAFTVMAAALLMTVSLLLCRPDEATLRQLQLGFVAGGALLAACLFLFGRAIDGRRRITLTLDPNDVAVIFAFTVPLALGLARTLRGWTRLLVLSSVPLLGVATLSTASRGGMVALGVGVLAFVLGQRPRQRILGLALLAIGALALWAITPGEARSRLTTITSLDSDYNTTSEAGRKAVWLRGLAHVVRKPFLGAGIGNYPLADGAMRRDQGIGGGWQTAHNSLVQVAVELGLPGAATFCAMLLAGYRATRGVWRPRRSRLEPPRPHRPEFLASLLAFIAGGFFLSLAYSWALLGLLALCAFVGVVFRGASRPTPPAPATEPRVGLP